MVDVAQEPTLPQAHHASALARLKQALTTGSPRMVGADGDIIPLPEPARHVLARAVDLLHAGRGVTVRPYETPKRTELTWIARLVAKSPLEQIETETDYLLAIGSSQPAFLVLINPAAASVVGPDGVATMVSQARRERRLAFQVGRAIVLAFNGAWNAPTIIDDLMTLLVRHQIGSPIPTLQARSSASRAFHTMRAWIRGIASSLMEHDDETVLAPAQLPAPVEATAVTAARVASEPLETAGWPSDRGNS